MDGAILASDVGLHGFDHSAELTLPPLGVVWLCPGGNSETASSTASPPNCRSTSLFRWSCSCSLFSGSGKGAQEGLGDRHGGT
jgi:hypothetical protein